MSPTPRARTLDVVRALLIALAGLLVVGGIGGTAIALMPTGNPAPLDAIRVEAPPKIPTAPPPGPAQPPSPPPSPPPTPPPADSRGVPQPPPPVDDDDWDDGDDRDDGDDGDDD